MPLRLWRRVAADSGNVPLQIPLLMLLQYSKDSETAVLHEAVIYKTAGGDVPLQIPPLILLQYS